MATLDLRKGLYAAAYRRVPTLSAITAGLAVHHNVEAPIMNSKAALEAADSAFKPLPTADEECQEPCFFYSSIMNEAGVEGVFRGGYGNIVHNHNTSEYFGFAC